MQRGESKTFIPIRNGLWIVSNSRVLNHEGHINGRIFFPIAEQLIFWRHLSLISLGFGEMRVYKPQSPFCHFPFESPVFVRVDLFSIWQIHYLHSNHISFVIVFHIQGKMINRVQKKVSNSSPLISHIFMCVCLKWPRKSDPKSRTEHSKRYKGTVNRICLKLSRVFFSRGLSFDSIFLYTEIFSLPIYFLFQNWQFILFFGTRTTK